MAKDIVDIAISEIGYKESGNNRTKYGQWFGMNGVAWCHMFVSWCAAQAGVSSSIVPKTASCASGMSWFKDKGLFKAKGSYTPKRGDILYLCSSGSSHVGIVETVTGSKVQTVEGNYSDKVARVTRSLSDSKITGYGVPKYTTLNGTSTTSSSATTSQTELEYLKRILSTKETVQPAINASVSQTNQLPLCNIKIVVKNGSNKFTVPVKDGLKIVWERKGTPGKLTFEAKYEKNFPITEGNAVWIFLNNKNFFYGFVFSRNASKDGFVSYTVYDQLRYLKNKETLIYKNKTANQVIKIITQRFSLNYGYLADTQYKTSAIEDDTTLFDIIQNILDNTLMVKNQIYTLYDDFGKLTLKKPTDMKVNSCLIDEETAEDYTYKTSIDDETYNQIKLIYENSEEGTYDLYVAKNSKSINEWGLLQYLEKINDPDIGKLKSQAYLKIYNKKTKNLTISGVLGNEHVRAGCLVPVVLSLIDIKIANYMLVEKVTHNFKNNQHTMDLILSGGDFTA